MLRHSLFSVQDHHPDLARSLPQLYADVIEQCEVAEQLGYHTFFVAEHHFHEYGAVPNPAVFLAALAQRTKRIRLGSAISILTFHNPLTVAENYAMVDVLSGGRLTLGVGSGYLKHEFEGYAIDGAEKRERFDENLAVMERALAGERVHHMGKFGRYDNVAIQVQPVQKPTPPIYVAVLRKEAAYHVGRQGRHLLAVPYATVDNLEQVGEIVSEFRRGYAESGAPGQGDAIIALHTHVGASAGAARSRAEAPFNLYVKTRLYARQQTYDDVLASGLALMGSVETTVDKILRLKRMGVDHIMHLQNFGMMPQAHVLDSMRLLAEQVMPRAEAHLKKSTGG
jgi:alkanesulfonate monooxygenase SsuD/methylene tetrahydromethanopterin reductase-like flavin-dependent oxidoreductase (luciferase family)